jgi:hypothetical protein
MKDKKWIFNSKYLIFYWGWHFDISYEICGYFDNRPRINLDLIFFSLQLILPFRNKWTDECDAPKWGIAYHNQTLWIHKGGKGNMKGGNKWWTVRVPWSLEWYRTSALKKDGTWEHEIYNDRIPNPQKPNALIRNSKNFYEEKWKDILWSESYPYTYKLQKGETQYRIATIRVEEMEWRLLWFMFLPIGKTRKSISIDFDKEVGEGTGSWKGGCMGCSYTMNHGELPEQTLRRMEKERKF